MDVRIIHFYPDLMDLYGSRANVLALKRYLERLDCGVTVEAVLPGGGATFPGGISSTWARAPSAPPGRPWRTFPAMRSR